MLINLERIDKSPLHNLEKSTIQRHKIKTRLSSIKSNENIGYCKHETKFETSIFTVTNMMVSLPIFSVGGRYFQHYSFSNVKIVDTFREFMAADVIELALSLFNTQLRILCNVFIRLFGELPLSSKNAIDEYYKFHHSNRYSNK